MIRFKCPNCHAEYEEVDDLRGAKVACETCKTRFYVPEEGHEVQLVPPQNVKTEIEKTVMESPPQTNTEDKGVVRICESKPNNQSESSWGKMLQEAMKKLTRHQVIIIAIIFLTVIVLFFALILKGGPPRKEIYATLGLRMFDVTSLMIKRAISSGQMFNCGPCDIKIKNKYTREQNGETYYFYEFSGYRPIYEENKTKIVEIDSGTIVFVKQGKQWRYTYL